MLKKYGLDTCKTIPTPIANGQVFYKNGAEKVNVTDYRRIVGTSIFFHKYQTFLMKAVKPILRYVKGIVGIGIHCFANNEMKLVGISASYWRDSLDDRKSTSDNCFSLGYIMITWSSKSKVQ